MHEYFPLFFSQRAEGPVIKMCLFVAVATLSGGCASDFSLSSPAPDHPANPDAATTPVAYLPQTLPAYEPKFAEETQAAEHDAMKNQDRGVVKGMEQGSTKEMDHHSMKDVDHGEHWMAPPEAAGKRNPVPRDAASIARGNKLFQTNCASCHGKTGQGDGPAGATLNPKPPDLKTMAGHHSDGDLAWKIANGRGAMPAWKGVLEEKQIWELVNYIKSLDSGKKKPAAEHDHSKHVH